MFAKEWGVLGICKHLKPASHRTLCDAIRVGKNYWEPCLAWVRWSTQARSILNIAAELNQGRLGKSEDWAHLDPRQDPLFNKPKAVTAFRTGLDGARASLALIVNVEWVEMSAVRFSIHPTEQGWTVGLFNETVFGLFGALGAYLMLTISGSLGITYCSNCGELYSPLRAPRSDRYNFCVDCGKKAKNRFAVRRFRARASSLLPTLT